MNPVIQSLDKITTGYSVFEKDQVLTHGQLNSVADYFDDQTRLTRVKLLGVGIVCGLRVSLQSDRVTVTRGTGVTTDGDLLHFAADMVFDKFKVYDESNPAYGPFFHDKKLIQAYELVPQGQNGDQVSNLNDFAKETGATLNSMVAVLFMEGYVKDQDLCTGTDCDNLGKDFVNTIKLLLVDKASAARLLESVSTPADAFGALGDIVAPRPAITAAISTPSHLAEAYRTACASMHAQLLKELAKIGPHASGFLADVFPSDPAPAWITRLNGFQTTYAAADGIQYYYDFLKDLVETYNDFRHRLFGENTWCCPDTGAFPKHLLLGQISPGTNPDETRTGFYPSALASRTTEGLERLKFLARKLNTLIQTFQPPAAGMTIRVTPSFTEERSLEDRAIPYYYSVNTAHPVHKSWNFDLSRRGMGAWNYSYHAALYGAQGGAANPLASQIGRFSFFRVEGHLGQDAATVMTALENEIKARNLPFLVRSVFLGTDRTKVVKHPGRRYGDLHRFHYLLRQDALHQLDDVTQFSGKFKKQVDDAVTRNVVTNAPADNDGLAVTDIASEKHSFVTNKSSSARSKLNRGYSAYRADVSWKTDVGDTMMAAGQFKGSLGKVAKTEFNTPFDSLIGNNHILWLDWLDDIIQQKDNQADDRLLFGKFIADHPGIEHFAGVTRGGTFVLIHDAANKVVADFMLPYRWEEATEPEPEEPPLVKPAWKPAWIVDNGISINPSIDKVVSGKLDIFAKNVIDPKINLQKDYLSLVKDVAGVFSDLKVGAKPGGVVGEVKYTDQYLDAVALGNRAKQRQLTELKQMAQDQNVPEDRRAQLEKQAKDMEVELGNSVKNIAQYVLDSGMDVTAGTEGHAVMLEVAKSYTMIRDAEMRENVKAGLVNVGKGPGNPAFKGMIDGMIGK